MKTKFETILPWRQAAVLFLLCSLVAAAIAHAQPASNRQISLMVCDEKGRGIADALVSIGGFVYRTDPNGSVRFIPPRNTAIQVQVRAAGYQSCQYLLDGNFADGTEIYLARSQSQSQGSGGTVQLQELAPERRQQAEKLERQALAALHSGNLASAEELLLKAKELIPSSAVVHNNLGVVWLRKHNVSRAAQYFEKALDLHAVDPHATGNLGMVRWVQGRPDESYDLLSRAVEYGFSEPAALYILGRLALERGRFDVASSQLERVRPETFPLRDLYLTAAQYRMGKSGPARKSFVRFLQRNPQPLMTMALAPVASRQASVVR